MKHIAYLLLGLAAHFALMASMTALQSYAYDIQTISVVGLVLFIGQCYLIGRGLLGHR